jgi:hypothetical protein
MSTSPDDTGDTGDTGELDARGLHDWLYELLPSIYRERDAALGEPLHALLAVAAEQLDVVRDDIGRLYDDWFIETCRDWVVPYLGELVGFAPAVDVGPPADARTGADLARVLFPRAQVANTIGNRRRRGTLAVLEKVAREASGWPAQAVEFVRLVAVTQATAHLRPERGRIVDLRDGDALDRLGGPFESSAHTADTRRLTPRSALGRYAPHSVAVFLWRLQAVPVTLRQPYSQESVGPQCYTFSVLGVDTPLFGSGRAAPPGAPVDELTVPAPLRRRTFERRLDELYGEDRDVAIWWVPPGGTTAEPPPRALVPRDRIVVADLTDWAYRTPRGRVAVDPMLGRIAFPQATTEQPRRGIWVSYRYGVPAAIGGGEYAREVARPADETRTYRVGEGAPYRRLADALGRWRTDGPQAAVIEVVDSAAYVEQVAVDLGEDQSLELRAAPGRAPVLRLLDWQTEQPDALTVVGAAGSCFTLDGLLVTGRGMRVAGDLARLHLRHSTLVPGWSLHADCRPRRPTEASVELDGVDAAVRVEHSILGAIRITHDEVRRDPVPVELSDTVLDATDPRGLAVSGPDGGLAHARITVRRCTVFGEIRTHAVTLAENSVFTGLVRVARRQLGCVRFCYVPPGSRTPRRHRCQPDLAVAAVGAGAGPMAEPARAALVRAEQLRVQPDFVSDRYGTPTYAQLALTCAEEIRTGAEDRAEMGAYHDLFQPQRLAGVDVRLREHTPSGVDAAAVLVN